MAEPIKSVDEFIAWTKGLQGRMILYRGLANEEWEVESSANRRIRKSEEMSYETVPEITFQNYIYNLLDEASLQGFRERQGRSLSDLELLAELQHYGAATCLIDFTTNALIALWFACQEERGQPSKVVAMATDSIERFSSIRYEDLEKSIKVFLNQGMLWKWEPSGLNNRIVAQQSVFVFGEGRIEESYYEEITVTAACKRDIVETLEESFGIRTPKLFNDLSGFARHNAHDQPYEKFSAEDLLSLGVTFHQLGEYHQAIDRFGRAIELDSGLARAYLYRGTAKDTLRDHQGAIADLDSAIKRNPQDAAAYNNRGNAKRSSGNQLGAIADYDLAIELNPQITEPYFNRGNTKSELGNYLGAIADFDKATELNPQDGAIYYSRGNARHALGDYLGAIADYDRTIELNPQDGTAYYSRGNARHALGDYLGSIADYDEAIKLKPQEGAFYFYRGNAKMALGDYPGSIADYDIAIELKPQDWENYHSRGYARHALVDYLNAIADYDKAIELNPHFAGTYNIRGNAKFALRNYQGAIDDYDRVIGFYPQDG
ncbi:MAG: tetratricopeptide repeat protein, partial [Caldilineaceae bacterium]|nr:tetratricopeptide repeat protein [Caldilineaceae bacterium]